jgi:hypothetical protein
MNDFCSAFYGSVSLSLSLSHISPGPVRPYICAALTILYTYSLLRGRGYTSLFANRVGFLRGKKVNKRFSLAYVYARNAHPGRHRVQIDTSRLYQLYYTQPGILYYCVYICTRVGNEIITHDRRRMGHIMIVIVVIQLGDACSTTDVQLLLLLFVYNGFIDVDYMIL